MFETVRPIGVIACVISAILFFIGNSTDYWVKSDNGHYGLWEHCDSTTLNANVTKVNATTTVMPDFSSFDQDKNGDVDKVDHSKEDDSNEDSSDEDSSDEDSSDEDDDDNDDDDDDCTSFNLGSLPAFFHIVRMIMILACVVFAWGLLSGRTLRWRLERESSFIQTHLAELLGILACIITFLGLEYFEAEYKTFKPDKFPNSRLGWAHDTVKASIFLFFAGAIILMLPSIHMEYKRGFRGFFPKWSECFRLKMLCIRIGLKKAPSPEVSVAGNVRDGDGIGDNREADIAAGVHDISIQMSETGSDIFTVTNNEVGISNGITHSGSEPPAYEDVAPSNPELAPPRYNEVTEPNQESGSEPAPPSYADFMSGQYLAFAEYPNSDEPSAPPPPPPYNSTTSV